MNVFCVNHHQENKAKLKVKQQNLTSQILPVCSVYLQKRTYLHFVLKVCIKILRTKTRQNSANKMSMSEVTVNNELK
jgi:hypothetical protein